MTDTFHYLWMGLAGGAVAVAHCLGMCGGFALHLSVGGRLAVVAVLGHLGYTVFPNVKLTFDGEDAGELWWIANAQEQCKRSSEEAKLHYGTTGKVLKAKNRSIPEYLRRSDDDDVEAAMYVELFHRLVNMYGVTRLAVEFLTRLNREKLFTDLGPQLRNAINKITNDPRILFAFPWFFQYWIMLLGGVLSLKNRDAEVDFMAQETRTTREAVTCYLDVIETTYSSNDNRSMIFRDNDTLFFKYIPAAFRGIGLLYRRRANLLAAGQELMRNDKEHLESLDRALRDDGGISSLGW